MSDVKCWDISRKQNKTCGYEINVSAENGLVVLDVSAKISLSAKAAEELGNRILVTEGEPYLPTLLIGLTGCDVDATCAIADKLSKVAKTIQEVA